MYGNYLDIVETFELLGGDSQLLCVGHSGRKKKNTKK